MDAILASTPSATSTTQPLSPERGAETRVRAAQIRLGQYSERAQFTVATYDSGTERALYEIALTLSAEIDRLREERHSTNEALADLTVVKRAAEARVTELTALLEQAHAEARTANTERGDR